MLKGVSKKKLDIPTSLINNDAIHYGQNFQISSKYFKTNLKCIPPDTTFYHFQPNNPKITQHYHSIKHCNLTTTPNKPNIALKRILNYT